jgi:hypothetical protein
MGMPLFRRAWTNPISFALIDTLRRSKSWKDLQCCITLNETSQVDALHKSLDGVSKIFFSQEDLNPPFVRDWLELSAAWYDGSYTKEELYYFQELNHLKLSGFNPDIIISFTPVPFLRNIYDRALIFYHEAAFVSRPPYTETYYFDPMGMSFSERSFFNHFGESIRQINLNEVQKRQIRKLKFEVQQFVRSRSPFDEIVLPYKDNYDYLALLPLPRMDTYTFYSRFKAKFRNPYEFVNFVLSRIPRNVGLIVVPHPDYYSMLDDSTVAYLKNTYSNFIFHHSFLQYQAPSQFLLSYADIVLGQVSSLCAQTLLWDNQLVTFGREFSAIADSNRLQDVAETLSQPKANKENILYWLLTRYVFNSKKLHTPEWFSNFLYSSLKKYRDGSLNLDFFNEIDSEDENFNDLIESFNQEVPLHNQSSLWNRLFFELEMAECVQELPKVPLTGSKNINHAKCLIAGFYLYIVKNGIKGTDRKKNASEDPLNANKWLDRDYLCRIFNNLLEKKMTLDLQKYEVDEILNCLSIMIEILPANSRYFNDFTLEKVYILGIKMIETGRWQAGLKCMDFVEKCGKRIKANFARTVALYNLNRYDEAKEEVEGLLLERPDHSKAKALLGMLTDPSKLGIEFQYSRSS